MKRRPKRNECSPIGTWTVELERLRELLHDERGTASIETVIVLPVIALCWAGIFFYFSGYEAKINAATQARREAWVVSIAACQGYATDADCSAENGEVSGGWMEGIKEVPFLGSFIDTIFGSSVVIDQSETFDVPGLVGGGTKDARYTYKIMCNLKPTSVDKVLKDSFCGMVEKVGMKMFCDGSATKSVCD